MGVGSCSSAAASPDMAAGSLGAGGGTTTLGRSSIVGIGAEGGGFSSTSFASCRYVVAPLDFGS